MQHSLRPLAIVVALALAFPALAAAPRQAPDNDPEATSYQINCQDGVCTVAFDLGEIEMETVVPKDMPVKLELPAGAVPFLRNGGLEISLIPESLDLALYGAYGAHKDYDYKNYLFGTTLKASF